MGLFDDLNLDMGSGAEASIDSGVNALSTGANSGAWTGAESGGGFGDFTDIASRLWGASPTKTAEGSGALGAFSDLGNVAKAVLPFAQIGTGISGYLAQRDAMKQLNQQGRTAQQATAQQIASAQTAQKSAEMAQGLAPKAAELAPRIEAVADNVRPIMDRLNSTGDDIRRVALSVEPLAEQSRGLSSEIQRTGADNRSMTVDPVVQYAGERLARAQRGEIPPAIQAQISQWKQGALQKARDYLARSGMGDSTAMLQLERQIDEQASAAAGTFLQNEEKQAMAAFEQARAGFATTGNLFTQAGQPLKDAAGMYGTEGDILKGSLTAEQLQLMGLDTESAIRGRAAAAYGTAGNILAGSGAAAAGGGQVAGQAARSSQAEQQALEQLIASINSALSRLSGRAA